MPTKMAQYAEGPTGELDVSPRTREAPQSVPGTAQFPAGVPGPSPYRAVPEPSTLLPASAVGRPGLEPGTLGLKVPCSTR